MFAFSSNKPHLGNNSTFGAPVVISLHSGDGPKAAAASAHVTAQGDQPGMATLQEMLLAPDIQPRVVADSEALVTDQVAELSGVTGAAVKLAYNTVRKFDANHIHGMIETILPNVADALQPYWAQFSAQYTPSSGDFGGYLAAREEEVAEALLAITDRRRDNSDRPTIVKAYNTIRGRASKQVKAALPALGLLIQKYA